MSVAATNATVYRDSKNEHSFEDGLEFQDFVVEQFNKWGWHIQLYTSRRYQYHRGESVQRMEIKLDNRCTEFGRLSIEVGERQNLTSPWVRSGIYRSDNTVFYVQGNRQVIYLFDRRVLTHLHQEEYGGRYEESPRERPTVRKFYLPFEQADRYCITKLTRREE